MSVSCGNNAVIRDGCTDAAEQFIRLISRKQIFKPSAVELRACVFKNILLEEGIRSVGFGSKFITPQILCRIQRVMNACRVSGVENGFEFNLFGFAHDADFRSKLIERLDIAHAAEHLRGNLRDYRFKIVVHAIADVCFIKCRGIICEYVACHWKVKPNSPIYRIALDMLRRTRYEQTNGKVGGFGFFVRQGHAVIYLRSVIMDGGDIQPALKHAAIVFLLHSADLLCV